MQESVIGSDGISLHSVGFELFKKVLLVAMVLVCILLVLFFKKVLLVAMVLVCILLVLNYSRKCYWK